MMSICLQSMVDELMVKKSGGSIKKVGMKKNSNVLLLFQSTLTQKHFDWTLEFKAMN